MLLIYISVVVGSGLFSTHYHVVPVVVGTRYIRHCCFIVGTVLVHLYMEISVALVLTLGWRNTRQKFDVAVVLISDVGYWLV